MEQVANHRIPAMKIRSGFTIIEILMVMLIAAMVLAFGLPKFGQLRESGKMNAAKTQIASSITTARSAAVQNGRRSSWKITGNTVELNVMNAAGGFQQLIADIDFATQYNVTLSATFDSITYDARGMALVNNGRVYIRGARTDSVCITTLGAVLLKGCL